jgi:integrase/recombinase XerD
LREWYRIGRPAGWLFPGKNPVNSLTTCQLNRVCHMAAQLARINKRVSQHTLSHSFATHLHEQDIDIRVIQAKLNTTALYTRAAASTICCASYRDCRPTGTGSAVALIAIL